MSAAKAQKLAVDNTAARLIAWVNVESLRV
jgi:hypothetical protein